MHDVPAFVALGFKENARGGGGSERPSEGMQVIGKRIKRLKEGNR